MIRRKTACGLLLLLTAMIWGAAFVAQSAGGDAVGPYTFNCVRSLLGGGVLLASLPLLDRLRGGAAQRPSSRRQWRRLLFAGGCCGAALCVASNLQQVGLALGASTGKAGFLTACYILLVPLLSLFGGRRCGWNVWLGVLLALAGLYLLCFRGGFSLHPADGLLLLCALAFAVQILLVEHFAPSVDGVRLSCVQTLVAGALTALPMLAVELPASGFSAWADALAAGRAWLPILYAGVLSSGVAYTLQILGQKGLDSTVASLLMSLEAVFSALAGWALLHQALTGKELLGCALLFGAVVLAQLPISARKKARPSIAEKKEMHV